MRKDRSASHIKAAYRRVEAMKLRQEGLPYKEIGERLGCSTQRAHAIVQEEFARLRVEQNELAENILRVCNDRIEMLIKQQMQAAMKGDRQATDTVLRLIDRQARLFGVDAARKVEGKLEVSTRDPDQLRAQARMMGVDITDLEETPDGRTDSSPTAGSVPDCPPCSPADSGEGPHPADRCDGAGCGNRRGG